MNDQCQMPKDQGKTNSQFPGVNWPVLRRALPRLFSLGLTLVLLLPGLSTGATETPGWGSDLTNALQNAHSNQHPILLAFTAPWCPYCRQMENKTFKDQQVRDSLKQFERVSVDIDHNPSLPAQHGVSGIPAFVMLDSEGDEIAKTSGFMEAAPFSQWLADGMTNLTATAAQKEEFETRSNEVATALASADASTRTKALGMVLDCCERREKIYRTFGQEKLQAIARSEPNLLLDGLNHPALMARIRVANLLREKLGQQFDIDPWENAEVRQQSVQRWKGRLEAEDGENTKPQAPSAR